MRFHYTGAIVGLIMLAGLVISPIHASAEKSVDDVHKERKEVKEKLSDAEKKVADIVIDIDDLEQEMAELDSILKENKKQVQATKRDMDEVQEEIDALEKKIEERFDILKDRAKSYQESGGNARFLDVIFESKSFNEFISRVSAVSKITDADAELIEAQKRDKKKVEQKLESLEQMKQELEEKQEQLKEQKQDQKEANKELKNKKSDLKKKVRKLEIKDDELSDMESKLKSKAAAESESGVNFATNTGNGEYGWPTDGGYISSPMGERGGRMHKGIDIARTDRSTSPSIYAAEAGTVTFAGQMNGYGNTIIVDHGDGMETLYGHMASLKASNGQQVKRGQQIGVMGNTGRSTGIHLHFEVHKNGNIENPIGYVNK